MSRPFQVADLFCGAGGLTTGAKRALARMQRPATITCVNHWPVAIATHQRMHPEARHFCQDLATARPRVCVPEGYLDLLMAAPSCTYHSHARGGLPMTDQMRMDPWHIVPWFTELEVTCFLFENVPEFVKWGPVCPRTLRPIRSREGEYFRHYLNTLRGLGARLEHRKLVCANYGDATTRERWFMMGRFDDLPIVWPDQTHADPDLARDLPGWRPAREIIDWSVCGHSIYDRPRALADNTLLRIHSGITRYRWPRPFVERLRRYMRGRDIGLPDWRPVDGGQAVPLVATARRNVVPRPVDRPLTAISSSGVHHTLLLPFMLSQGAGGAPRSVAAPMPTTPKGGAHALVAPYYGSGSGETCKTVDRPLDAVTTRDRFALVAQGGRRWDITHRMFLARELASATGLDDYEFEGTDKEVKGQIGNAVPTRTGEQLVLASLRDLAA